MNFFKSRLIPILVLFVFSAGLTSTAAAQEPVSQSVNLVPGWNIVSTPMVLESHSFSAPETSENFDIYVLDASKPTGWATMADLNQTQFTPLFGYFVNNKTGDDQVLTFTYKTAVPPNEKLFERTFTAEGWYSIGVANAEYAKAQTADREDTDNPSDILSLLAGKYDLVIDFTDGEYESDRKSVALSDPWKAVVPADINDLNDFRDTKGYAIYIKESGARYNGFQNEPVAEVVLAEELVFSLSSGNPEASWIVVDKDNETNSVTVLEYTVEALNGDVAIGELQVNLQTQTENLDNVIQDVELVIAGNSYQAGAADFDSLSQDFIFDIGGDVTVPEGESIRVEVVVDFKAQQGNYFSGETIRARVSEDLVKQTLGYGLDGLLNTSQLSGDANGEDHTLVAGGILILASSFNSEVDTLGQNDTVGLFELEFEVNAVGNDFYITESSTSTSVSSGVKFSVEGGAAVITSVLTSTGDEDSTGVFTVSEGNTETFTLVVTVDPTSTGAFRVQLDEVWYSADEDGTAGAEAYQLTPASDFRTASQAIQGS